VSGPRHPCRFHHTGARAFRLVSRAAHELALAHAARYPRSAGWLSLWPLCFPRVTMSTGAAAPAASDLVPGGPAAREYQAPPLGQIRAGRDSDPLMAQVAAEVQKAAAALRAPVPLRDGRLDLVAIDIARATVVKRLPSFEAIAFLLHHYGIVEPEPYMVMVRSAPQGDVSLFGRLAQAGARGLQDGADWRRIGVGVKRGADELIVVLTLQTTELGKLRALPRRLSSRAL